MERLCKDQLTDLVTCLPTVALYDASTLCCLLCAPASNEVYLRVICVRSVETVEYKNISFTVWDVGGQDKVRSLSGGRAVVERSGEVWSLKRG